MNKAATFFLIFCLNSVLTYSYIYFLIGTFDVQIIWDKYKEHPVPLLYDVMQYNLLAGSLSLEDAINRLAVGSTTIHAAVLGYFFESRTLYSGLIVNSLFVTLTFWVLYRNVRTTLFSYLLLAPFFCVLQRGLDQRDYLYSCFGIFHALNLCRFQDQLVSFHRSFPAVQTPVYAITNSCFAHKKCK